MLTCKLNKVETTNQLILKKKGYSVAFYTSIDELTATWNPKAGDNLFLNSAFLKALEVAPPSGTQYRYGIVSHNQKVVGIVYFQVKKVNLYLSLRLDAYQPKNFTDRAWHTLKSFLAKRINQNILVNGNMTLTGNNGYEFHDSIDDRLVFELVDDISKQLLCKLREERIKVRAVLLKDYNFSDKPKDPQWSFSEFQVQPNMILNIKEDWSTFDDYLSAMKSKYRIRVRRARKKSDDLEKRVKLIGYFQKGKMVGFYTHIFNNSELDAHFLGYEPNCNRNCQLYLNMLYDLVDDAISLNAHNLILSRTAMEIKSSIGAEAHDMYLYMRTTNHLLNKGVSSALNYFKPKADWKPRSPFK